MSTKLEKRLEKRQKLFVLEYLKDLNATKAAERAGYSMRTANQQGARLLAHAGITKAITLAMDKKLQAIDFSADRVLQELARLAMFDPAKMFNEDGSVKRIQDMDENTRMAIAGFEVVELGEGKGVLKRFKLVDKGANLERLGKYHALFVDRVKHDFGLRELFDSLDDD